MSRPTRKRVVALVFVLVLCVAAYSWWPWGPHNPQRFFTPAVEHQLSSLSEALLSAETSRSATVARQPFTTDVRVVVGTGGPAALIEDIGKAMRDRRFHYVYIDRDANTVTWAFRSWRILFCYTYSHEGPSSVPLPKDARSVKYLNNTWLFFVTGGT